MFKYIYRLILRLYPRSFRENFGAEAVLLLGDRWRDERGFRLKLRLIIDVVLDMGLSLVREHTRSESGGVTVYGAGVAPMFTEVSTSGPSATALWGGALTSGMILLTFAMLVLPQQGQRNPSPFLHDGLSGLGSWLTRARHTELQASDRFEVASLKPGLPQGMMFVRPTPGRLTANASLQMLIQNAYGIQAFQVEGGPDWARSERYAIEATTVVGATRAQILTMLQPLLSDRFQLKFHRETRELPAYALTTSGKPATFAASKEGSCAEPSANAPVDWSGGRMAPPDMGTTALPQCGMPRVTLQPNGAQLLGRKVSMSDLARTLSLVMERTVIDRTGLSGVFDLELNFDVDETTSAMPPPPPGMAPPLETRKPTIFSALQEQLGLKLASTKGPVEVIVIEHAERPTPN